MERTLIKDLPSKKGEVVLLKGRIQNMRKLGAVSFTTIQDYSGSVQVVWDSEVTAKTGDAVTLKGTVKEDVRAKSGVELQGCEMSVVAASVEEYPFDITKNDLNVNLSTLLDHRTLTLRNKKVHAIFKLYDLFLRGYETMMRAEGFTEIKSPKLLSAASEGGANFFKVEYFGKSAYLAQSPQLYKQISVGAFERVFEIGSTFRAEPHFTTRHVNEYISLDGEMGFIEHFTDITAMLNKVLRNIFAQMKEEGAQYLELFGVQLPEVPEKIPHIKLAEMKKILKEKYNHEIPDDTDIDTEGEKLAGRYAKEELGSDFLFVTHYPMKYRPFYTKPDPESPEEALGFDLLFNGLEIVSGGQRIHIYEELMAALKKKNVSTEGLEFYLDTFKFAMPPHGGWGLGSERVIQKILGLESIKEAVLFPRDVNRLNP